MTNTKTTCQICEREIKASTGVIAHHGYQRPWGQGWQSGSCFGARHLPYEQSCDVIPLVIGKIKAYAENQRKMVQELKENPPAQLTETYVPRIRDRKVFDRPEGFDAQKNLDDDRFFGGHYTYEYEHRTQTALHKREAEGADREVKRLEKRLVDWVAPIKPLGTYKLPVGATDCGQANKCNDDFCVRHAR